MSIHDYPALVTVKSGHSDGDLALYKAPHSNRVHLDLGDEIVASSDVDLVPLAKAILNAMEPKALVENLREKATAPEPEFKVGDRVLVTAFPEDDVWHNHVGILVRAGRYADWEVKSADGTVSYATDVNEDEMIPAPAEDPIAALTKRVEALEAAADTEIRVGDTVTVKPSDWNIVTPSSTGGQEVTGTVRQVDQCSITRYLVEYTSVITGILIANWATKVTKVRPND